ncbi:hypothetical protein LPJ61_004070 [Coemansia biformis]|uniref:MINDY deubiquitinase domain-containing protein n=1 Tax=Coemansia biformis TaxID=1286918 RepID=A0A9W7YB00_9FUNG|nr:hypothetical protein LPJ61_004070 [Coemansia biformis]
MTDDELTGILANLLFDQQPSNVGDVSAVLSLLPLLHKGLDVDLRFSHIRDFAETANARLFAAFGVELVHGWVVDEQSESEVARVLGSCGNSYEGAVEFILAADELSSGVIEQGHPGPPDGHQRHGESSSNSGELDEAQQRRVHEAIALNEWLQATATQLTERGLAMLQADLGGDSLSVMFRNNHFSTLFRRADGQLFLLCTDDVVAADPRIVWESLSDVHQATSQFVDSRFLPLASGNHDGSEGGGGGGSSRGDGSGDKRREGDYARQGARYASREQEAAAQIDSDYAMALRLHEEERERDQQSQLQVRQQDRHPPGMDVKRGGNTLFNVPEVTREGETRLARAIHRTQSDENFDRQMQAAFLPNEAVRARPPRQRQQEQQQQHQQAAQDKCVIQ